MAARITMEFGENIAVLREDHWFYCYEKNVKVSEHDLLLSIKKLNTHPLRTKFLIGTSINYVGYNGDDYYDNPNKVFLWRDENKTHIGCLWEYTTEFNRKYVELRKKLNNK